MLNEGGTPELQPQAETTQLVLQRVYANTDKGPQMNPGQFFADVGKLDRMQGLKETAIKTSLRLEARDNAGTLLPFLFQELMAADEANDAPTIRRDLKLIDDLKLLPQTGQPAIDAETYRLMQKYRQQLIEGFGGEQPATVTKPAKPSPKGRPLAVAAAVVGIAGLAASTAPDALNIFSNTPPAAAQEVGKGPSWSWSEFQQTLKPVNLGTITTNTSTFYKPGSDETVGLPMYHDASSAGETIAVLEPAGNFRFRVRTPQGEYEVPMDQIEIQGDLLWARENMPRLEWLSFDCAQPELIKLIPQIGAAGVRISIEEADETFFSEHPDVLEAISKAKEHSLDITLLLNTRKPLPQQELKQRVDRMLSLVKDYPKASFIVGNEQDLPHFWDKHDLKTFAKFFDSTSKMIWEANPDARVIVGAVYQTSAVRPLVQALHAQGVDLQKVGFALHADNSIQDVEDKVNALKAELSTVIGEEAAEQVWFMFGELGWNRTQEDKGLIVRNMAKKAQELGAKVVNIFQLRDIAFSNDVNDAGWWGFVSPDGQWEEPVKPLIDLAWEETHKPKELKQAT